MPNTNTTARRSTRTAAASPKAEPSQPAKTDKSAKPERYRGFLAAAGLAGGSVPFISPAELSDAGAFDVVHVGRRMGTDMDGNPQREVFFDVVLIEGIGGEDEDEGGSKAQRLSLRETDQRVEQARAMHELFRAGHTRVGPFRLDKFAPEKGNPFWTLEDVDPAPLVEQWNYVIPPCHPAASEAAESPVTPSAPSAPSAPSTPATPAAARDDLPF